MNQGKSKHKIILIHGTFAPRTHWVDLDANPPPPLAYELRKQFAKLAQIKSFPWSGKNRPTHRREAAVRLARCLNHFLNKEKSKQVFIIAHSHGGNIAYDAASILPKSSTRRVSCFFLGTPFIIQKARFRGIIDQEYDDFFLRINVAICFLSLIAFWTTCYFNFNWNPLILSPHNYSVPLEAWIHRDYGYLFHYVFQSILPYNLGKLFFLIGFFLAVLLGGPVTNFLTSPSIGRFHANRNIQAVVYLNNTDEAVMGLIAISAVLNFLQQAILIFVGQIFKIINDRIFVLLAFVCVISYPLFLIGYLVTALTYFTSLRPLLDWILFFVLSPLFLFFVGTMWLGFAIIGAIICLTCFGLLKGIAILLAGVSDTVLAPRKLMNLIFSEVSIGAAPVGNSEVLSVRGNRIINHTKIYDDPEVIESIKAHISSKIARPPASETTNANGRIAFSD